MKREGYILGTVLLGVLVIATGCTTKKQHQRDIINLQGQIGTLQSEVARLDQALRDTETALKAVQEKGGTAGLGSALAPLGEGPIYRTPSGFELPATAIQRALKKAGYYGGSIDGKVGSGTKEAIRGFQRDHGMTPDGVCGRQTWAQLKSFLEPAS